MRLAARESLLESGKAAVPTLLSHLKDSRTALVLDLLDILAEVGDPRAAAEMGQLLEHKTLLVRLAVLQSFKRLLGQAGRSYYQKGINDVSGKVRRKAARLLVLYKDKRGIPELIRSLRSQDKFVRFNCIEILRKAAGQSFGFQPDGVMDRREKVIKTWETWWDTKGAHFQIQ